MSGCVTLVIVFFAALAAAFRPVRPFEVPPDRDVYAVVAGTWDWAGRPGTCRDDPHTLAFSPDRATMVLTFVRQPAGPERETRYEIRGVTRSGVRGFITGETRRTAAGEPVVWDLVLTSPDSYRWHRTDWAAAGHTSEVVRCPPVAGR